MNPICVRGLFDRASDKKDKKKLLMVLSGWVVRLRFSRHCLKMAAIGKTVTFIVATPAKRTATSKLISMTIPAQTRLKH